MEIALDKLNSDTFSVRDEVDDEHISEISESLEKDGQWNPIIVRPGEQGSYDIIAGHTRYKAAERLGWDSLEATVKDVDDERGKELALKTNLKRKSMSKIEEGKIVNEILDRHNLTERKLAEQIGKSQSWINDRIRVALDLEPEVRGLVEEGELSYSLAREVRRVDADRQLEFARLLIDQNVTSAAEASERLQRFQNDTIVTVGYEGRDFDGFVSALKDEDVDVVIDVRASGESTYKPEFSSDLLEERLAEHGIGYRHEPELGVHRMIRDPYKDDAIGHECFADWYQWWIDEESEIDVEEFTNSLVETGTPAFMCIERHPEPRDDQEIYCHRHHLAEMIQSIKQEGRVIFPERIDL
jgi:ParB family chromosome partitioning protein